MKSGHKPRDVVDSSNESFQHADEELGPNLRIGSPLKRNFKNVYVRVFKRPNVGFFKQADFCGTSILNYLILVCMLFCIKGKKKPVKCDRLIKRKSFLPCKKHRKSSNFGVYCSRLI